jgi:hypothetical protein
MNNNTIEKTNTCLLTTISLILGTISTLGWIFIALVFFRNFTQHINILTTITPLILSLAIAIVPLLILSNIKERLS